MGNHPFFSTKHTFFPTHHLFFSHFFPPITHRKKRRYLTQPNCALCPSLPPEPFEFCSEMTFEIRRSILCLTFAFRKLKFLLTPSLSTLFLLLIADIFSL